MTTGGDFQLPSKDADATFISSVLQETDCIELKCALKLMPILRFFKSQTFTIPSLPPLAKYELFEVNARELVGFDYR